MAKMLWLILALFSVTVPIHASMTISGTRIIYVAGEREVSVRTNNKGQVAALVQVWIDSGDINAMVTTTKEPFIVTPPIYRVEPGKGQSVRLIYNGMPLPQDRESLFWFNLLEIPPVNNKNDDDRKLELAFRTRIKLFYRPAMLAKLSPNLEIKKLQWQKVFDKKYGTGIAVKNPTSFYYSINTASVISNNRKIALNTKMILPNSDLVFYPEKTNLKRDEQINALEFGYINDFGAVVNDKLIAKGNIFILE